MAVILKTTERGLDERGFFMSKFLEGFYEFFGVGRGLGHQAVHAIAEYAEGVEGGDGHYKTHDGGHQGFKDPTGQAAGVDAADGYRVETDPAAARVEGLPVSIWSSRTLRIW